MKKTGFPTKPGWYWKKDHPKFVKDPEWEIVRVRLYANRLTIQNSVIEGWDRMEMAQWAGPLQEPKGQAKQYETMISALSDDQKGHLI